MKVRRWVHCDDGTSLSVQASKTHYCEPREDDAAEYTHVEVGFITKPDNTAAPTPWGWKQYADGDNVYAYVPAAKVHKFIEKHGGAISGELPPFALGE